ncbi:MAG: hypothetical protein LBQ44_10350, partial [Treponema sp.]|nr:hypothetical protein [Treponema sp.]
MTSPGSRRSLRPARRPPAAARFAGLPGLVILAGLAALTGLAVPACGASGKNGTPRLSAGPAVSAPPSAEENPPRQLYTWERDSHGLWIIRSIAAEADIAPRSGDASRWTMLLYYRFPAAETGPRGALTWKAPPAADGAVTETVFDFFPKALEHRPLVFNGER